MVSIHYRGNHLISPVSIPNKEIHKQIKSNLRTSIYCKIRLVVYLVQDELRNKSTGIIHNELIMRRED